MCLPSNKSNKRAAAQAEADERRRQQMVQSGYQNVDNTFKHFNDDFFGGVTDAYTQYYLPQVDRQFDEYSRKNILSLFDKGILASSAGGRQKAAMQDKYNRARDDVGTKAVNYENALRGDVASTKSELKSLVAGGIDPGSVASLSAERAGLLAKPHSFEPLGDFFNQMAGQINNRNIARSEGYVPRAMPKLNFGGGSNNVAVVR
jgi:hypothetical protein